MDSLSPVIKIMVCFLSVTLSHFLEVGSCAVLALRVYVTGYLFIYSSLSYFKLDFSLYCTDVALFLSPVSGRELKEFFFYKKYILYIKCFNL